MFGNPNVSATPVDDIYASQADTYGNSFANPVNPANMNSGWGIDPSLLSPSYTSSYRPSYSGSNGAVAGGRPGFFGGLNNLAPWQNTPMWGNPNDHQQSSVDSVASRPVDAGMWAAQRIAMPVAAVRGAGALYGGYNGWGMGKNAYSMGRNLGRGFGGGLARGMGAGTGGLLARGMTASMGGVMGAAVGWALPMATAQAAMWAGEKAIFDPYINTRRSSENLRDNFAGITYGDSQGNSSTGGGLSGRESVQMGRQLTQAGIHDMKLSTGEFGAAANMIGRSGLTDNVNSKDIVKRIKDSVEQMKLIMSIAQMPEMKDAIEHLSKMQRMGANVSGGAYSDAAGTMRQLGGLASVAGTNVQKLMNTVGAQGQYLYQANGMTPYMGQLAAANSYASLSAGNRQGLISSAQLARLGGLDGATQATLTGELNASQTTYNKMMMYNQYMGKGKGSSALGNISQFGQSMSRDPMGTHGGMLLYGNQMAANQMNERGSLALDDQVFDMLKNMPGMLDKNGKISIEKATPFLMQMGMSTDQIHAYASKRISETNSGVYASSLKGLNRNLIEQQQQLVEQNTLYGGVLGRTARSVMKGGRTVTSAIGDMTGGNMASIEGSLRDGVGALRDNLWYGDTIKSSGLNMNEALNGKRSSKEIMGFDTDSMKEPEYKSSVFSMDRVAERGKYLKTKGLANELNSAKDKGDINAIAYFNATTPKDKQAALNRYKESGKMSSGLNEYYSDPDHYKGIEKELAAVGREKPRGGNLADGMMAALKDTFGFGGPEKVSENGSDVLARVGGIKGGDIADNARAAGMAIQASTSDYGGKELSTSNIEDFMKTDTNLQALSKATGITDPQDLLKYINKTTKAAADNKVIGLTTNSLKVKGKGVDVIKAAGARNGDQFYDENAIETKNLDSKETKQSILAMKENSKMKGDLYDKYKSGHLDFSGFQESMNALDNKKAVKDFAEAVGVFAKAVNSGSSGDKKPNAFFDFFKVKSVDDTQKTIK